MANPFEKRATEYSSDSPEAFFSIVTPEPLRTFLEAPAKHGTLYDRLVLITGTPGSGKTTIASMLQFHFVDTLRRNQRQTGYRELVSALKACEAIDDDAQPVVAGVRLPLESEYRDFWQLPYSEATRTRLVLALLASRAMLGWIRNLTASGAYKLEDIRIVPRASAAAATAEIGGTDAPSLYRRAAEVERAVYQVGAALVPPNTENDFPEAAKQPYRPFDAIEAFEMPDPNGPLRVRPFVMLDDAHTLHPQQLRSLNRDLARRELKIARWVLTRVDVLSPTEALLSKPEATSGETAGPQFGRDVTLIAMQKGDDRGAARRAFRKMARDMADRYLRQMPEFVRRSHENFGDLLETVPSPLPSAQLKALEREVDATAKRLAITDSRRKQLAAEIARYLEEAKSKDVGDDIELAMLLVMMNRYAKRVPQGTLFEQVEDIDPRRPLKADASVAEAARIQLHHSYGRPYYYGIETVCDAASENAEQFLHLAAKLVDRAETRLVRNRNPVLNAHVQHSDLKEVSSKILEKYDYPYAREALALADELAKQCLARTLEPNASLGAGANAIGIPQSEFENLPSTHPRLASVLQFAVAYNVITLAQNYGQGNKVWCQLELGGCVCIKHGLTLRRGGFLERVVSDLNDLLPKEDE